MVHGTVQVERRADGKTYALKRVNISKMKQSEVSDTLNEIRFLSSVRHPYVVGFLEAFLDRNDTELCIVMEYCSYGDLAEKVERYKKRRQYIDEKVIWAYLIQCLEALTHLHSKKICHRDLKPANCFLCDDGTIKIGDMNVSKRMKVRHTHTHTCIYTCDSHMSTPGRPPQDADRHPLLHVPRDLGQQAVQREL